MAGASSWPCTLFHIFKHMLPLWTCACTLSIPSNGIHALRVRRQQPFSLAFLTSIPFTPHQSFILPPHIRSRLYSISIQKAHHPNLSIFLLNLVHPLHILPPFFFLAWHYRSISCRTSIIPPIHTDHPIFSHPLFLLTPWTHTSPPSSPSRLLGSAAHRSSSCRLPPRICLPLHPFTRVITPSLFPLSNRKSHPSVLERQSP